MNLDDLTQFAGSAAVTAVLMQALLAVLNLTGETKDRIGPLLSMLVGVVVVLLAEFGLGLMDRQTVVQGIFTGVFAGLSAIGIYKVVQSPTK